MRDSADSEELLGPLLRYAARFHRDVGAAHQIGSPLGAWLLLAATGTAAHGPTRQRIAEVLGMDADRAAEVLSGLLGEPHEAVGAAAAAWTAARFDTEALREWRAKLPRPIMRGPMPSQEAADAWMVRTTKGLMSTFPLDIGPLTAIVLANAIAVRSEWMVPYDWAPAAAMASGADPRPWAGKVQGLLIDTDEPIARIVRTRAAGDVAMHSRDTKDSLRVHSVIAERSVPPAVVMQEAHRLAVDDAFARPLDAPSLFDLPLTERDHWKLQESPSKDEEDHESYTVILPAWSARSSHDLASMDVGVEDGMRAVQGLLSDPTGPFGALQAAVARYHREGFEAAAASMMVGSMGRWQLPAVRGRTRHATLTFRHPYAVVAVAIGGPGGTRVSAEEVRRGPWHGVPIFAAWVTRADEVERPRFGGFGPDDDEPPRLRDFLPHDE